MKINPVCLFVCLVLLIVVLVAACPLDSAHGEEPAGQPAAPASSTVQVMRTGQRTCYGYYGQNGQVIDCAGTGQDGDIQAGVAWPDPRFEITYCDSAGPCADQSEDCDQNPSTDVSRDLLTGLVWTRDALMVPISVTWDVALDYANNLTLCGYDDWRLPNALELTSLQNPEFSPYTYPNPEYIWLQEQGFVNVWAEFYWSSTGSPALPGCFFESRGRFGGQIDIRYGYGDDEGWKDSVWPVRAGQNGGPDPTYPVNLWKTGQAVSVLPGDDGDLQMGVDWPEPRFTNPDGTVPVTGTCVLDNLTGLMWPREMWPVDEYGNPADEQSWVQSLDRANSFDLCGYDDWRLPNMWEMLSLVDFSQSGPALPPGHPFQNVAFDSDYATSTTYPWWTDYVTILDIGATHEGWWLFHLNKDPEWYYNMPVRGGIIGTALRPDLSINYNYGKPGSYLTITGLYWAPNGTVYATVNGVAVGGEVKVSGAGGFTFALDTSQADRGTYTVKVTTTPPAGAARALAAGPQATVGFRLDEDAPLREWDGTTPIVVVPAGIGLANVVYLPAVYK